MHKTRQVNEILKKTKLDLLGLACPIITAVSCFYLIATSMSHLVGCYTSALIDCLPKTWRSRCLFGLTNGRHISVHLG